MTHTVTEACIRCKYMDCIEVCPVSCFYEGKNMLVINPSECIDCGICIPECPAEAIIADTNEGAAPWVELNQIYAKLWPKASIKSISPSDADDWLGIKDKFSKYFYANIDNEQEA